VKRLLLLCLLALPAFAQTSSIVVSWVAPTTATDGTAIPAGTVFSYDVYQYIAGVWTKGGSSATLSYTVTGLTAGQTYSFYVVANAAGFNPSGASAQVSAVAKAPVVATKTLSPPTGVKAQ